MPVTVLRLVDGEPLSWLLALYAVCHDIATYFVDIGVVARDYKFSVVEEVVDDTSVGPRAVFSEQSERCVPVEELLALANVSGKKKGGSTVTAGTMPLACISEITSS